MTYGEKGRKEFQGQLILNSKQSSTDKHLIKFYIFYKSNFSKLKYKTEDKNNMSMEKPMFCINAF